MTAKRRAVNGTDPAMFLVEILPTYRYHILLRSRPSGETRVIRGVLLLYVTGKVQVWVRCNRAEVAEFCSSNQLCELLKALLA